MRYLKIDNFILKLIAIITMTLDHVGFYLTQSFLSNTTEYMVGYVFRCIGRLSFPLFCFLLVEGAIHTSNWKKYALRLTGILVPILIGQIIAQYGMNMSIPFGNVFIDLLMGLFMITSFKSNKKSVNLLGFLPILYGFACFGTYAYEASSHSVCLWFPYFLRAQYNILGIGLMALIYFGYRIVDSMYKDYGLDSSLQSEEFRYRLVKNGMAILSIVIVAGIDYMIHFAFPNIIFWDYNLQWMMVFSSLVILFYNGIRGYDKLWFRITSYFYYPVHLLIIYLIFYFITII